MTKARELALLAFLLCVYCVLLGRTVTYEYVWDDVAEIQSSPLLERPFLEGITATQTERQDPSLTELTGVQLAYDSYRPLLFASYWLEVQLWGRSAAAMHVTNLVLGALVIVCVLALSRWWLGASLLAFAPAALVAIHPAQVEAVAYISGRGDLLAGLLALIATLCVMHATKGARAISWTVAASFAFAASLFTKESAIGLPIAILALLWAKRELRSRWWVPVVLIGVALTYLVVRRLVTVPTTSSALVTGVVALPGVCIEYMRIALLPFDLSTERMRDPRYVLLGWAACAVAIGACIYAWRRGGSFPREPIAGVVWFAALLGPSAVAIGSSTGVLADRYLYLPLVGLAIALVAGAEQIARRYTRLRRPLALIAAAWGLMLILVTWMQVPVWRNNHTLYSHAVAMTPTSSEAHYRLGYLAARANDWDHAIPLLERAVELDPRNVRALVNLGVGRMRTGDWIGAERSLARAVEANPASFRAWFNLGLARLELGRRDDGCAAVARAMAINPRYEIAVQTHRQRCH